jgi:hypothetical protein
MKMKKEYKAEDEIIIEYPIEQKEFYQNEHINCIYPNWERKIGIHKGGGNFPVMVATKYYEDLKFNVINNYLLVRMKKKRYSDIGFRLISSIFTKESVEKVLSEADSMKLTGGDPDMFVYNFNLKKYFFIEVKENDKITSNQKKLFPIIDEFLCPVYIARIKARKY